jgi:hypothetical protein
MNTPKATTAFRLQSQSESEGFARRERDLRMGACDAASESEGFAR